MKLSYLTIGFGLLALSASVLAADSPNVKTFAAAVDAHYNHLQTLQTEFTEIYRGSGIERS